MSGPRRIRRADTHELYFRELTWQQGKASKSVLAIGQKAVDVVRNGTLSPTTGALNFGGIHARDRTALLGRSRAKDETATNDAPLANTMPQ